MKIVQLSSEDNKMIRQRIKRALRRIAAKRIDKPNPWSFLSDFAEAKFVCKMGYFTIICDNWVGVSISGDDGAVDFFLEFYFVPS